MSDGVMSQDEIDALVGADPDPLESAAAEPAPEAAAPDPAPAAAAPTIAAPSPAAPAPAPAAAEPAPGGPKPNLVIPGDGSHSSDMIQRLASLEAVVATLQQSGGGGQDDAVVQALNQQVQALGQQVQALTDQLTQLGPHLQNSLGFGLRASFQCASCNTQGLVGSRVSCMRCGTESWIGWSA